ncbi:prepilin peptidase [Bdellovibrio bacteriovorus]|uniref:Prepilin leader peptidase/N-methyltransferase n=1 Tax=Bdellovibrio bacteriovorus str. Tiberius TaxID=1069642 RepID=K7YL96_BDEBC|nr:A24 family peptidase [Bdellovibrio bacteriovorus]AFY00526.1 leader peptidase (prepilin peptidase) [Bdellovibrio bacteriovorus str. Tiberius]
MFDLDTGFYVLFFVLGAIFGSFGNVVIYRLPREESVVKPRSYCYSCKTQIKWYDNIPILSWFILRGKCRKCHAKFSFRYPLVEIIMAVLFALCYHYAGLTWTLLEYLIFIFGLVVCTFIDLDHMILPDEFTLSGIVIGLVGAALNPQREFLDALFGVLMGGGFLWGMAYVYYMFTKNEGMGGGDIKLLAWIGAIVGWKAIPFVIMTSAIVGSVIGLIAARKQKAGLKTVIPFGPYLALGAVIYLFGGEVIALWYLGLFLPAV